ncbi:endo 1,5-alpha-arabinase [Aspergillus glaucus CBS 516.65]|uniref:Arabinan endo-1,5-alpha-L-arabinosidase n=1 Tax=Aspergillus glaucus CBS 516.65 TaxID=1160497 RepID=A0A1L9V6Y3_ASPGL|nr:hypothetical protein ASPGLDRAFT_52222 [Aspergillus glaucus CBS 516.65]OJJ79697.1 hypothetical protein ASPGLDRAFT_52222 [Aspergillus glaucus CBS 516.65]
MSQSMLFLSIFLVLTTLSQWTTAIPAVRIPNKPHIFSETKHYPLPNLGNVQAHDPNIVELDGKFYLFKGGVHVPIHKASSLDGPWQKIGTVLDGPSVIEKQNRTRPWAPTTVQWKNRFYCFYTISKNGVRNSAIGVASSDSIDQGGWTDHGAVINTEKGPLSDMYPLTVSNAIDASFIADQSTGKPYLLWGSYWHGIFQLPLADDLLSVEDEERLDAKHLVFLPEHKVKPQEGSFMTYREPYYYLWFSHGKCCGFHKGFPVMGREYSIRVGRSKDVTGPFVDKSGKKLLDGGGTTVYGSNHGLVYAPGGIGVLPENKHHQDIMYYHYLNTTIGFLNSDAQLGWSYIEYDDGWPVARAKASSAPSRANYTINLMVLMFVWVLVWIVR